MDVKKLLPALLLAVTIVCALVGCRSAVTPDGETGSFKETSSNTGEETVSDTASDTEQAPESTEATETTAQNQEITMEPKVTVPVIQGGVTNYVTVIAPEVSESNAEDVAYLFRIMDEKYGTHPPVADAADQGVIRLSVKDSLGSMDWALDVGNTGNIELTGGSPEALSRAIEYFITAVCANSDGDLLVPADGDHTYVYEEQRIDNSGFLSYEGGDKTVLVASDEKDLLKTPAWLDTAVMVELRIDMASIGGTFKDSYDLIDFYASAGVNVLWLSPVYERGAGGNGYGNVGLHRIEPWLTGTTDQEAGWNELKQFVDYAHSKGVYVLLDIITWGTMYASPLLEEHPDWYNGEAWGNAAFDWSNAEFREWFIATAVENLEKTGADGYRCDCEPFTAGYDVFAEIRTRCNAKGIYPVIMAEAEAERRDVFDCEQDGVIDMDRGTLYQHPVNFFADGLLDVVSTTKRGQGLYRRGLYRYYTNCITNHDYQERNVNGNRLKIGYAAIYAPYIPLWYMGDEFGVTMDYRAVLYDVRVDYGAVESDPEQSFFFEDVKQMIAIRRTYPEIFEEYPLAHKDTAIKRVEVEGLTALTNYARYAGNKMIIVVANNEAESSGICKVEIPFDAFEEPYLNYKVTDLLTGQTVTMGYRETVNHFSAIVPYEHCGVYLVEGVN